MRSATPRLTRTKKKTKKTKKTKKKKEKEIEKETASRTAVFVLITIVVANRHLLHSHLRPIVSYCCQLHSRHVKKLFIFMLGYKLINFV
jgi:hypothetical protein